ncbi:S8/S53 family peptidase [Streptacidiphilus sp. PB12-B1b]|uniref:S53 family peptidase n=1 Tax=Streptacidiphilus sp. PB12-B1b TaxID=2705012 RepID=UPI0015F86D2B|nr:S53 family peptidase [Streptacidiphilus sp. PB12-B1b]QMU77925.1 S8/S53 family peptidase [Streptacidiphilus sp. PB12-B1b]
MTRTATVAFASFALVGASLALAGTSQADTPAPQAKVLAGSHPDWATATADAGVVPAATQTTATVYLAGRNSASLQQYATEVSEPTIDGRANPLYGKFLTAAQAKAEYLASPAQITAVRQWLTGAGLRVTGATEHEITVSGSTAAITRAFGTRIDQYRVGGKLVHAPASDVVVPAGVSSAVLGVLGLSSTTPAVKPDYVRTNASAAGTGSRSGGGLPTVATCSNYWGQRTATGAPAGYTKTTAFDQCSLDPAQERKAYGINASHLTGKGATVAIVDAYASSTMLADADQYAVNHGDKPFKAGQYSEVVDQSAWNNQDACGGPAGWAPEEALDVEMVHGLAPDANVVYVGANSCTDTDLLGAISDVVDNHLADVISNSWGEIMHTTDDQDITSTEIAAFTQVFEQAAIEGIGINFSAGDCGDSSPFAAATGTNCQSDTAYAQADWPDSSPWVTSVGGTALGLATKSGVYGFETDMGTLRSALSPDGTSWTPFPGAFYFGGGGGTSQDFAQPWYQAGVVPSALSHTLMTGAHSATAQRVTPDVAMNGDLYTSVLVGISDGSPYSEAGYGGTSVSSPSFAAVQADAIQAQGHPIGFANPEIYARSGLFTDVVDRQAEHTTTPLSAVADFGLVSGSLRVRLVAFGQDTSLNAVHGYDDATGVGTPTTAYLDSFKSWYGRW